MKQYIFNRITRLTTAAVCCLAMLLASCGDFLEENPKDRIMEEAAYKNRNELFRHCVASLYNNIGGYNDSQGLQGTGRGIYDLNTFTTNEAIIPTRGGDWYDGGFWQGLYQHKWGVNNGAILATWEYLYKSINLCNTSLRKIDIYAQRNTQEYVEDFRAEVRAIRALFYYYTMDLFGRIPLTNEKERNVSIITQKERSEVALFIFNEMKESLPLLSDERSNTPGEYYGRVTKAAAMFVMAKVALNAEIYFDDDWTDGIKPDGKDIFFEMDGNNMNAWETTEYLCSKIGELGYILEDNYESNFSVFNESSKENIFIIPMNKTLYTNQFIYLLRSRHYNHAKAYGLGGENGAAATTDMLETFGYDTENEDPRFEMCYFDDNLTDLDGNPILLDDGKTVLKYEPWKVDMDISGKPYEKTAGARMKKYEVEPTAFKDGKLSDNDIVLFRYSDVLLMKCEAKVRNGENGDEELNMVRSRVGADFRTATLDNIMKERTMELVWEGWHRQDMIRFGTFNGAYSHREQLPGEESGYTTVFPIPNKILQVNEKMEQNKGYE